MVPFRVGQRCRPSAKEQRDKAYGIFAYEIEGAFAQEVYVSDFQRYRHPLRRRWLRWILQSLTSVGLRQCTLGKKMTSVGPIRESFRVSSRFGPRRSHNVSSGTRARWPVSSPICLRVICIHWEKAV